MEMTDHKADRANTAKEAGQKTLAEIAAEFCKHAPQKFMEEYENRLPSEALIAAFVKLEETAADAQELLSESDTIETIFDMYNVYRRDPYKPECERDRVETLTRTLFRIIPRIVSLGDITPAFDSLILEHFAKYEE